MQMVIFTVPVEHLHVCVGSKNLSGWQLFFGVPDDVREATALDRPPEASNASCLLHQLNSDPNIFMVPLGGCGGGQYVRRQLPLLSEFIMKLFAAICSRMSIKECLS